MRTTISVSSALRIDSRAWRNRPWRALTFLPLLTSSILNFRRRKRVLHWYSDQSNWRNGVWKMRQNGQKFERKTQSKISCDYMLLLHGKSCPSRWCFLNCFLTGSKPSRRSITAAKQRVEIAGRRSTFKQQRQQGKDNVDLKINFCSAYEFPKTLDTFSLSIMIADIQNKYAKRRQNSVKES